jgi:16S rRNA (uracil1498-N3)-methyltransferase
MEAPFFYLNKYASEKHVTLDEETSRHIISVLRMKKGDKVNLTDGKGNLLFAEIINDHKKHCSVEILESKNTNPHPRKIIIAISLLKSSNRFEWFLEKATEIGVNEILPIICSRTEKQKFREERLRNILVSAMLQSQQCWLPVLHKPVNYDQLFHQGEVQSISQKFIAHCIEEEKRNLSDLVNESLPSQIILIGPEGDFTPEEIQLAIKNHFVAVSLGETRLRAETAGVVAATLLRIT